MPQALRELDGRGWLPSGIHNLDVILFLLTALFVVVVVVFCLCQYRLSNELINHINNINFCSLYNFPLLLKVDCNLGADAFFLTYFNLNMGSLYFYDLHRNIY